MASNFGDLNVMNSYAYSEYQVADTLFREFLNARSGGAIVIENREAGPKEGDYHTENFWGSEPDKARFESPSVQTSTTARRFKMVKQVDIRLGMVFDQYEWQSMSSDWIGRPPEEQARLFARTVQESFARKYQEAAGAVLTATFSRGLLSSGKDTVVETVIHDIGGGTTPDTTKRLDMNQITQARLRMGDMYEEAAVVLMHTGAYAGMTGKNLEDYKELFVFGNNVQQRTTEGLPIFLTDLPILTFTQGTATKYRTFILKRRAIVIYDNGRTRMNFDTSNGETWINDTAQAQTFFNIKPLGYTWSDTDDVRPKLGTTAATGKLAGLHTDSGVLDNPASWARIGVSEGRPYTKKELAGVMIIHQ